MENKLIKNISKFKGNILCIGIKSDKILKKLESNNDINVFLINRHIPKLGFKKSKKATINNGKKINIKKLEKTFRKKSINSILCSYSEIYDYFKYFIDDSINICTGSIYIYGEIDEFDVDTIINRYNRYHLNIEKYNNNHSFLIIIKSENKKIGYLKKKGHIIINSFKNVGDLISNILIS